MGTGFQALFSTRCIPALKEEVLFRGDYIWEDRAPISCMQLLAEGLLMFCEIFQNGERNGLVEEILAGRPVPW